MNKLQLKATKIKLKDNIYRCIFRYKPEYIYLYIFRNTGEYVHKDIFLNFLSFICFLLQFTHVFISTTALEAMIKDKLTVRFKLTSFLYHGENWFTIPSALSSEPAVLEIFKSNLLIHLIPSSPVSL